MFYQYSSTEQSAGEWSNKTSPGCPHSIPRTSEEYSRYSGQTKSLTKIYCPAANKKTWPQQSWKDAGDGLEMYCGVKTAPSSKQPYMDTRWKEKARTSNDHLTANGGTRTKKPPPHLGNNRHYGPRPAEVEGFRCCPLRLWRYGHMMMMMESSWVGAACAILRNIEGLGLDKTLLFWLDPQRLKHCDSPVFFFFNLFKVWSMYRINRANNVFFLFSG